jgi:hypothetical protein
VPQLDVELYDAVHGDEDGDAFDREDLHVTSLLVTASFPARSVG